MIISKTPLRISFVGGGSDMASFYQHEPGAVVSTTINKYVYIAVNKKFDDAIRLSYKETENVPDISKLKHNIARETLRFLKIKQGIEISSIGDIPAETGLATSGAYTVGLLNALITYQGKRMTAEELARNASIIEIEKVGRPIGKQDQYVEAYGGLNYIQFNPNGSVKVVPIKLTPAKKKKLQSHLLLFYTGYVASSAKVLSKQKQIMAKQIDKRAIMSQMVGLAKTLKKELQKGNIDSFGKLLHENWLLKKKMAGGITNRKIDEWYEQAIKNGAIGGKICGSGGRGFLLLYAPPLSHKKINAALSELQQVDFSFEEKGSTIIYNQA
ncbi:MAG TPA: hypothetical protein VND99_04775 [Candidatus Acidoferrales bacterium]|nr:hypothetical protein [Candidatus Acidoferrales bacterium]